MNLLNRVTGAVPRITAAALVVAVLPVALFAQSAPDTKAAGQPISTDSSSSDIGRPVSWARIVPNTLSDQKRIWLFPLRPIRGKYVIPTLAVVGVTAALIASDPQTGGYFHRANSYHTLNSILSGNNTSLGTILVPASLYAAGWIGKSKYNRSTALLAGEAVLDAEILTTVFKDIDRRKRPAAYSPTGDFVDSWFNSQGSWIRGNGSFPSGHTIAAFSVATVISRRYGRHRWVPYVAYGLASAVGLSRMTLASHFPSDVFAGGALGYSISRFVVLRQ